MNHGGKRINAGRKALPDTEKKKTVVIRIDYELLPSIEQLKQGLNLVTIIQEIDRLKERNLELVYERDNALHAITKLTNELTRITQNKVATVKVSTKSKPKECQCVTRTGNKCDKAATHENALNGFMVLTCERHYKSTFK